MSRLVALVVMLVAPVVALALLAVTGGLAAETIPGLPDPGAFTRYGLPVTQALRDLGAATTVGALMLAACCIPPPEPEARERVEGARRVALDLAAAAASVWLWSGLALLGFTYSEASGNSLAAADSLSAIIYFAENFELGRYLTVSSAIATVVSFGCLIARRTVSMGLLTVVALIGLWPMALTGHAAGTLEHDNAVNLQAMHVLGVSIWTGGLIALLVTRHGLGDSLVSTVRRYSTMAGFSLVLVAVSGVLGALLRVPELSDLRSSYGALLALKGFAFAVLCGLGWWQRRRLIARLAAGHRRAFLWIGLLEVVVLTAASGTGVALSRTAPPPPPGAGLPLSAAQSLLGNDLPPALGAAEWFTQWRPDTFWLPIVLGGLAWYLVAVSKLRARGDTWPRTRTIAWVIGCALLVWATSGSPGVYGRVLFSMHMVAHMTIATAVPVFLALGAPVTLALRTLKRRTDRSMGPREWLQRVIHSWPAAILANPIVAATMFIVSLAAFYYSSLFELSLRTHTAHILMVGHFVLAGYLLANCLVGIDPGPRRPPYPLRALLLMITFGFHALFSVSLMASNNVLASSWFGALGREWGESLIDDQYRGASLGWALGDLPLAILAGALIVAWVQADRRERRRFDRKADRDGDSDLNSYNDYLSRLAAASASDRSRPEESPGQRDTSADDRVPRR